MNDKDQARYSPLTYLGLIQRGQDKVLSAVIRENRGSEVLPDNRVKFDVIVEYFCNYSGYDIETILQTDSQSQKITIVRKWITYFAYLTGNYSFRDIGTRMKPRDHSSVIYNYNTLNDNIDLYKNTREESKVHHIALEKLIGKFVRVTKKSKWRPKYKV